MNPGFIQISEIDNVWFFYSGNSSYHKTIN
jgi:hypothetical protein